MVRSVRQTCRLLYVTKCWNDLLGGSSLRHQIRIQMKALRAEHVERSGCGLDKGLASSGTLCRQSSGYHIEFLGSRTIPHVQNTLQNISSVLKWTCNL